MRYGLLILIGLVLLVIWLQRRFKSGLTNPEREELERLRAQARTREGKSVVPAGEAMLSCAHCGVYFPQSKARWHCDKPYCSRACFDAEGG